MNTQLILTVWLGLLASGCAVTPHDITDSKEIITAGWKKNQVYETTQPTFLVRDVINSRYWISRSTAKHLSDILAHQCGATVLPRTLEEFKSSPEKWPHIVRVLSPQSKVRFERAYHHGGMDGRLNALAISGTLLLDPPIFVELLCISTPNLKSDIWERDNAWLKE